MRYVVTVYFDNPVARWQGRAPAENEILSQTFFRWEWLANAFAAAKMKELSNVGVAVEPEVSDPLLGV